MGPMRATLSLLLLLATLCACSSRPRPEPIVLTLQRADTGGRYRFEERRADATIVYFFSTWCVLCQAMEPFVAEAARQGRREGIEVVGVALDADGAKLVRPYVLATEPPYPVLLGGTEVAEGRTLFGRIPELPSVMFLDSEGRPSAVMTGLVETEALLEQAREVSGR